MLQLLKDVDKLSNNAPIGVFDSGLGGLTVWREVRRALPAESLVYLGDGKNCPYGSRPREEVRRLADEAVAFLVAQGCKLVVVACNTATAAAIDFLREKYAPMPIVGMEPAVKPACLATRSGVVGVLATERSLDGELFRRTAARYGDGVDLVTAPGRGFVELVENDLEATPEAEATVRAAVAEMLEHGADQIVLGCTPVSYTHLTLPTSNVSSRAAASRSSTRRPPSPAASCSCSTVTACTSTPPTARNIRSAPLPTRPTASAWNARPWGHFNSAGFASEPDFTSRYSEMSKKMRNFA